ncbi:single-strand selective monofunctional uracil DNA glycosylase [Episyrphus balteatus]|uniref:single-strand selective monofunctional uracil DNA glycosylase n=1 Tax=Episyrphus balteatus TaxID=286459 RepID=UPI0024857B5E|nr:single-strand selective monofunctional uracil DNA glycosylase [Episyrphus balteatus]
MEQKELKNIEPISDLGLFATEDSLTSKYFPTPLWKQFIDIECNLNKELANLKFPNITHVYNPIEYAFDLHCQYLKKYLNGPKKMLLIGMNPGPNGMAQNGVPFGNTNTVKNLMKIEGQVEQPPSLHPKRPVTGLACKTEEPSGVRIWTLIGKLAGSLEIFSQQCFMHNFCPLAFFDVQGKNITPGELKGDVKAEVRNICLKYLEQEIQLIQPEIIIAIGSYVGDCMKRLAKQSIYIGSNIKILQLAHPSPRSVNNNNWPEKATEFFESNDLLKVLRNDN